MRKLKQQACRRRFNVYHAVHSTSMLPLRKVTLLLHDDAQRKAIFCSASPEAFGEEGPPLDKTDNEQLVSILEHRQLCVAMSSGDVYVSRQSPQALAHREARSPFALPQFLRNQFPRLISGLLSNFTNPTWHVCTLCRVEKVSQGRSADTRASGACPFRKHKRLPVSM